VLAASSPKDCFETAYEAVRIALQHMTPVFVLSDGYIANGAEPWMYPKSDDLKPIDTALKKDVSEEPFLPYERDEKLVRAWAIPGVKGLEHRIGGLEKEDKTGNVSYDPENHQKMVELREAKVQKIAEYIPEQKIDQGSEGAEVAVLSWGSTYGAVKTAVKELLAEGENVAHIHLRYIKPFPKNLEKLLKSFDRVLVPELNSGQLVKIVRSEFLVDARPLNKIKGLPFSSIEIKEGVQELLSK
jgi:2-oxoglutarate ferredoxin oxidoreductase subunit alpha